MSLRRFTKILFLLVRIEGKPLAMPASFETTCASEPAERAICPPLPPPWRSPQPEV